MKHNVGDVVRIKSKEWYEKNRDEDGNIRNKIQSKAGFTTQMSEFCGMVAIIVEVFENSYYIDIDGYNFFLDDYMFEDSIEEPLSEGIDIEEPLSPLKVIDCEHYELVKSIMANSLESLYRTSDKEPNIVSKAIKLADEMIKQLKESEEK